MLIGNNSNCLKSLVTVPTTANMTLFPWFPSLVDLAAYLFNLLKEIGVLLTLEFCNLFKINLLTLALVLLAKNLYNLAVNLT